MLEKLKNLRMFLFNLIGALNAQCAGKDEKITELTDQVTTLQGKVKELTDNNAAEDAELAELLAELEPFVPNPSPAEDAVIELADQSDTPNAPLVDEALSGTVGTEQPTSPEAVEAAIEQMLAEDGAVLSETEPSEPSSEPSNEQIFG